MEPKPWYSSNTLRTAIVLFFSVLYLAFPKLKEVFEGSGITSDIVLSVLAAVGGLVGSVIVAIKRLHEPIQQPIKGSPSDPTK